LLADSLESSFSTFGAGLAAGYAAFLLAFASYLYFFGALTGCNFLIIGGSIGPLVVFLVFFSTFCLIVGTAGAVISFYETLI